MQPSGRDRPLRIGTWNLAGRWSAAHRRLIESADCDVWLLTEVPAAFTLGGGHLVRSEVMGRTAGRSWAAVWAAQPLDPVTSPHEAAAFARLGATLLCSCVLPWRGARATWPDGGERIADMTTAALGRLAPTLRSGHDSLIWGGDWNHAMRGREYAGSVAGRPRHRARLAREPCPQGGVPGVHGGEALDRDGAPRGALDGAVHGPHAAAADLGAQVVAFGEGAHEIPASCGHAPTRMVGDGWVSGAIRSRLPGTPRS